MSGIVYWAGTIPPQGRQEMRPPPNSMQATLVCVPSGSVAMVEQPNALSLQNQKSYPVLATVLLIPKAAIQLATIPWRQMWEDMTGSKSTPKVPPQVTAPKKPKKGPK